MHPQNRIPSLRPLVVLQALTLVAVVAGQPSAPDASAFNRPTAQHVGRQQHEPPTPVLPNAAAQRAEMIRLLAANLEANRAAAGDASKRSDQLEARLAELTTAVTRVEAQLTRLADGGPR